MPSLIGIPQEGLAIWGLSLEQHSFNGSLLQRRLQ